MTIPRSRVSSAVSASAFKGFRSPPEVIILAVRWYLRYGLSYRDVEELLVERGVVVDLKRRFPGWRTAPVLALHDRRTGVGRVSW